MIIKSVELGFETNAHMCNEPSIIIKIGGCNMQCIKPFFPTCSYVNTKNVRSISFNKVKKIIDGNPQIHNIVFYGGEPLLYKAELEKFLNEIWRDDLQIVIKTNGTLPILNPLGDKYKIEMYNVFIVSDYVLPHVGENYDGIVYGTKEVETMKQNRLNYDVLSNIAMYSKDYVFNFLIRKPQDVQEVEDTIKELYNRAEEDDFINSFFQKYPIERHIAIYGDSETIVDIKSLCLEKGWNNSNNY